MSTRALGYSSGHISNVENGHVTPSHELVETYIALGAERATTVSLLNAIRHETATRRRTHLLTTRANAGHRPRNAPASVGPTTLADDVRTHYTVERYDVRFTLDSTGSICLVESEVALRALSPDVRYYFTGHSADASGRAGRLRITAGTGASIERINESPSGAANVFFRLDHDINPDDRAPFVLTYLVEIDDDARADPQILYLTRPGIQHHSLDIQFAAPATPSTIWWFGAPTSYDADRPEYGALMPVSDTGRYSKTFDRIVPGWCYGFTWVWPEAI